MKETFTEDREEWQKGLQKHCEEASTDQKETQEVQEDRIEHIKKKGDQQFTVLRRTAEITVDLVLQARAKMSDNKVNRRGGVIVRETIKQLSLEKHPHCHEMFSGTLHGPDGISKFVEDREIGLLEKTRCCPGKRDQKLQGNCADISDVEVVCILYYSS